MSAFSLPPVCPTPLLPRAAAAHSSSILSLSFPLPSLTCFLVLHQLSLPWVSLPLCLHWLLSGLDCPWGYACFPPCSRLLCRAAFPSAHLPGSLRLFPLSYSCPIPSSFSSRQGAEQAFHLGTLCSPLQHFSQPVI